MPGTPIAARCAGLLCLLFALSGALSTGPAHAQQPFCPDGTIKIVVPFPPGGPVDSTARVFTEPLKVALGQTVILEHRAGASGALATAMVAQAAPNGCTMLFSYDTHAVNPAVMEKLTFDTVTAFKPVTLLATVPNVLVVHPSQPWKTLDDVVAEARKKDGDLVYGTGGTATLAHLAVKRIEQAYNIRMRHVAYRGGAPALQDTLGGHVPIMMGSLLSVGAAIKDNRLRAILQTGTKRHPALPDTPTVADVGQPSIEAISWVGVFLPSGASDAHVSRLNAALKEAVKDASIRERMGQLGFELVGSTPQELQTFVVSEIKRWTEVVKQNNIKLE
jgi:tripartite-type tricarboxylate transporter receptor subunit TctC